MSETDTEAVDLVPEGSARHVLGDPDAPVTIVEFGDYECPYCGAAAPVLHHLVDESDGHVRLVFRHLPLFQRHPFALTAALAAEAAGEQGAFWPLHQQMFAHQDRLTDEDLVAYGADLGLDGSALVGDGVQHFGDLVEDDYASAVALGVRGTPGVFVDGRPYQGRLELRDLRAAVGMSARGGAPRSRR
ncbi:MAG: thioredoxin domain-containing protein [Nocardioidaceae bacterium]|nr:thioredoxin domain-containing protein [Nocardioidaceae bacterium]